MRRTFLGRGRTVCIIPKAHAAKSCCALRGGGDAARMASAAVVNLSLARLIAIEFCRELARRNADAESQMLQRPYHRRWPIDGLHATNRTESLSRTKEVRRGGIWFFQPECLLDPQGELSSPWQEQGRPISHICSAPRKSPGSRSGAFGSPNKTRHPSHTPSFSRSRYLTAE